MCGFTAIMQPGYQFQSDLLKKFDQDLYHRGPDAGNTISEKGFALVFRRLSILDIRQLADQPMSDPSKRYTLVFNGEIYNYKILRKELEALGVRFQTTGDTEVLLQGFIHWGKKIVERLEGMFAFVIIDRDEMTAYAARDAFGIKPLYLRKVGQTLALSSEMRPLLRLAPSEPDLTALTELIAFGWAAGSLSNVKNIERVRPGTILQISLKNSSIKSFSYFDILETLSPKRDISFEDASTSIGTAIEQSVSDHLASDVGYTLQLSGGVDSSLVTALSRQFTNGELHTFGVNLGNYEHDEQKWRQQVVERYEINHHEIPMESQTFADELPRAVHHMEGPVPHGGCVLLMHLCDYIKHYSKVVLTGEGADELFGGYQRYADGTKVALREEISKYLPVKMLPNIWPFKGIKRLNKRDAAVWASVYGNSSKLLTLFPDLLPSPGERERSSNRFHEIYDRLFAVDQTAYLESLLVRQDKMAMAASVESRVPFVHMPLLKAVNNLPHSVRAPGGTTKPLLKNIAEKHLPREILHRRKNGLLLPYDKWCREANSLGRYLSLLTDPDSKLRSYSHNANLQDAVRAFREGDPRETRYMFRLINIELWLRDLAETGVHS